MSFLANGRHSYGDNGLKEEADYEHRRKLIDLHYRAYVHEHPHKWLGLTIGDVWVLADSLEALVEKLGAQGLPRTDVVIRYLNPDPVKLVL